jgi:hypothetical protein
MESLDRAITLMEQMTAMMEANLEEIESVTVQEKVPNEEAAVKTFGALKKQHGDQHLGVGCC